MCSKGFFKRIVPFFLTFAVGLFVASFFVTVAAPSFQLPNRGWQRHRQCDRMREYENQRLRERNFELEKQLSDNDDSSNLSNGYLTVPPPPMPPMPPPAPMRIYRR